jgi:hypothetical protein
VARAVGRHEKLTQLDLESNRIEQDGLVALAESLQYLPSLCELRLGRNAFAIPEQFSDSRNPRLAIRFLLHGDS